MPVYVTRQAYYETALAILAKEGHGALKMSAMCKRLGVTTGSFYNYFGSFERFVAALLEHWEAEQTQRIFELSTASTDPRERIRTMKQLAATLPHDAESAIRAWSKSNSDVAVAQKRVDGERAAALRVIVDGVVPNGQRADLLAVIGISLLVGIQQWRAPVDIRELVAVFDEFEQLILRDVAQVHPGKAPH